MVILEGLNAKQQEAVCNVDGPLLILAGAGSGKTRVLTHRIAYLIRNCFVSEKQILATTFTNKAAKEIQTRVETLLKHSNRKMWIGTFHSLCVRILRAEGKTLGLESNFVVYDNTDQMAVLRKVMRDEEIPEKQFTPQQVRTRISREKNQLVDAETYSQRAETYYDRQIAKLYLHYQNILFKNNAVDFDDLLVYSVRLFLESPDILKNYQNRFRYILVDEYQDTNRPQYLFIKKLAEIHRNICVVGDDDQSIYTWRGADIRNILDFEVDYPDASVIRLEQNYRSTQVILDAGNAVIRNNFGRKEKKLWTDRIGGEKIRIKDCLDEVEEAWWIARTIQDLFQSGAYQYKNMAVLYRTNAQSRALEEGMRKATIPYVIVGGIRFYERKEVKDILAYLRLIVNPKDWLSFGRVINFPRRGIGVTSVSKLLHFSEQEGIAPYSALERLDKIDGILPRARKSMEKFYQLIEGFRHRMELLSPDSFAAEVVESIGYLQNLQDMSQVEVESQTENIQELLAAIQDFSERTEESSIESFLHEASLMTDIDGLQTDAQAVKLMTLHNAKGLEFSTVFIGGLEEGLFPILRSEGDGKEEKDKALEEERRLFYVGITRSQERLFLSYAAKRRRFGGIIDGSESRFVKEIPESLIDMGFRVSETELFGRSSDKEITEDTTFSGWDVGHWVLHPTWGRGQIQACSGQGERAKLTVRFQGGLIKTVVAKFAGLEPG